MLLLKIQDIFVPLLDKILPSGKTGNYLVARNHFNVFRWQGAGPAANKSVQVILLGHFLETTSAIVRCGKTAQAFCTICNEVNE